MAVMVRIRELMATTVTAGTLAGVIAGWKHDRPNYTWGLKGFYQKVELWKSEHTDV